MKMPRAARCSLFGHEDINMPGQYSFVVPELVESGKLRPLRDPEDA